MKQSTREAYSEVDAILNLMDKKYVNEIPENLRLLFKEQKAQDYYKTIDPMESLENQNLKEETLAILAALNYNYWCKDQKEKQKLLLQYTNNEELYQRILRKVYNPDKIFENSNKVKTKETEKQEENLEIIKHKENKLNKLWNKIKLLFVPKDKIIEISEKNIIQVKDKNGNSKEICVLMYFTLDIDGNDYILYVEDFYDTSKTIYAAQVIQENKKIELREITNQDIIEEIKEITKELKVKI